MVSRQSVIKAAPPGAELVWVGTYLPVRRWRDIPVFMNTANKIARQVEQSEGAVRYGLKADPITKNF